MKNVLCLLLILIALVPTNNTYANKMESEKVLLIYSTETPNDLTQVRILETLIGHFSNDITIIKNTDLNSNTSESYSSIFYLGLNQTEESEELKEFINEFKGSVFFIGKNVEQFEKRYSFISTQGEALVDSVSLPSKKLTLTLPEERIVLNINANKSNKPLLIGIKNDGTKIPLLIKKEQSYYFASVSLFNPMSDLLGEILFDFFNQQTDSHHYIYLRLEDIHPKTDVYQLKEIAKYLKEKQIPYMVLLIPVYTNPNTGTEMHLSDSPELVKTLRYMQKNGASIILHGYRHQYKTTETGEGFEYWDVKNDRPILQPKEEIALTTDDFATEEEYQNFLEKGKRYEAEYIENTIQKGIEEAVTHKLYPLGFEAPHYTMSEQGYEILSKHFSTYIGQIQLTNQTWKSQYAPLFDSTPNYLYGMKLLPETIGYVEQDNQNSLNQIKETISALEPFSESYIAGFYHPYLGLEKLKKFVGYLENVPNSEWVDLKQSKNHVVVSGIMIESSKGKITVEKDFISSEYEKNYLIKKTIKWSIPLLIIVALLIYSRVKRKKHQQLSEDLEEK